MVLIDDILIDYRGHNVMMALLHYHMSGIVVSVFNQICFHCRDIILKANDTCEDWMCKVCSLSEPHLHAHKAILCASCDHMRALLCSGMQERYLEIYVIKICTNRVELCYTLFSGFSRMFTLLFIYHSFAANRKL